MNSHPALQTLRSDYQAFEALILSLSDGEFLAPGNDWSPRDVVAHLVGWNDHMIEASSSILAGEPPAYYADAPSDYKTINARFVAQHSSTSKTELLRDLRSSMDRFVAFLAALPTVELTADHGVKHYSGRPATVIGIIDSLSRDYRDHTRQVSDWMCRT
jgi:hypothetical protein